MGIDGGETRSARWQLSRPAQGCQGNKCGHHQEGSGRHWPSTERPQSALNPDTEDPVTCPNETDSPVFPGKDAY